MEQVKVGNERDLKQRVKESQGIILVRAINDYELDQLVDYGVNSFKFNPFTEWDTFYSHIVQEYAQKRTGTVIVYQVRPEDVLPESPTKKFDFTPHITLEPGERYTFDRFARLVHDHTAWARCNSGFGSASVEVYNTQGLSWQDMKQLRSEGSAFDRAKSRRKENPAGILQHLASYLSAI